MPIPIIIVDDNDADRYLIKRSIEETAVDCLVTEFTAGDDFLSAYEDPQHYSAMVPESAAKAMILLDINMPRLTGFDVLERLAETPITRSDFVVMMITSSDNVRDKDRAKQFEFVKAFAVKPLDEEKILDLCANYF